MKIAKDEIFGPVITIYKFKTEEEAIAITNCSNFGLGSSVFSLNYERAERVARKLKVGMSNVNGWGVNYLCQVLISVLLGSFYNILVAALWWCWPLWIRSLRWR
jgi:acyl-CoA reductase-like NAD-dependent aldehyde dehydrogenase